MTKTRPRATRKSKRTPEPITVSNRQQAIAEAAYYIAQSRGFEAGAELDDWLAAEHKVDAASVS